MLANAAVAVGLMAVAFGVAATRRPRAAHAAWLVVLLKLVTPPLVVVPVIRLAAKADEPAPPPKPIPTAATLPVPPPEATGAPIPDPVDDGPTPDVAPTDGPPADVPPEPAVFAEAPASPEPVDPWRVATAVWLAGAAGWLGLVAVRVGRFRRFVTRAEPADADTLALARSVADRLGLRAVPAVAFVDGPVSPMLWAVAGRPRIVLPRRLWAGFGAGHRETVLAHELAHLARGDHWVRRFELVVLAAYWWCPVAWVAVRQLRRAEEACCDARVLAAAPGRAAAYAEALVETIAFVNRPGWVPLASGGAARASDLQRRVTMILSSTGGPRTTAWFAAAVILAGLAVRSGGASVGAGPGRRPEAGARRRPRVGGRPAAARGAAAAGRPVAGRGRSGLAALGGRGAAAGPGRLGGLDGPEHHPRRVRGRDRSRPPQRRGRTARSPDGRQAGPPHGGRARDEGGGRHTRPN
jgi:beta-lactamase regulating signal transducer with metallopeptidase domain